MFREKGYLASSQRELAKRAGIKGGSLYHHFSSKQEILFEIMESTINDMIDRLKMILLTTKDAEDSLRRAMEFHIDYVLHGADETYISDDELRNLEPDNYRQIVARRDIYQNFFEMIFQDGKIQKNWQVPDSRLLARMVILMGSSVGRWYKTTGPLTTMEIVDQYVELICRGLESNQEIGEGLTQEMEQDKVVNR